MTWFIGRSIVVIVLAFVLGLLVGWLWWRRRKVQFSESKALADTVARKNAEIQAMDDEIARLTTDDAAAPGAGAAGDGTAPSTPSGTDASPASADRPGTADRADTAGGEPQTLADGAAPAPVVPAPVVPAPVVPGPVVPAPVVPAPVVDPTAGIVVVPTDPTPEQYEVHAVPVEDIPTGGISVQDIVAAQVAREAADARSAEWGVVDARDLATPAAPGAAESPARGEAAQTGPDTQEQPVTTGSEAPMEPQGGPGDHQAPIAPEPSQVVDVTAAGEHPRRVVDITDQNESADEDDLERVEGIGPRIGAALRNAGIHTFRELADADTATLQGALEQAGLRFAPSLPTWSRQARFLADGDEAGFQALRQQLVGGSRDISRMK